MKEPRIGNEEGARPPCRATLHVWVEEEEGRPRRGCLRDDFEVFEDSVRREIAVFVENNADAPTPQSIVIAVDATPSGASDATSRKQALWKFLPKIPRGAAIALLSFSGRIQLLSGFETDRERLRAAVERIEGDRGSVLYDALLQALSMLEATGNRSQFLVLVGGTEDTASRASYRALEYRMSSAPAVFFAAGQLPLPIESDSSQPGERGVWTIAESRERARWRLTRLATLTGGLTAFSYPGEDLGRSLPHIANALGHHYLVEYYISPASRTPRFHRVEVRLKPGNSAGLRVRSRRGYLC